MQLPIRISRGQAKPWAGIPRIDKNHPLAKGLVLYCYDAGGGVVIDLVSGRVMTSMGTPSASRTSAFGSGNKYPDNVNNSGVKLTSSAIVEATAVPFSFASGFLKTGNQTANFPTIFSRAVNDGASSPYHDWEIQTDGSPGSGVRMAWNLDGTNEATSGSYTALDNVYHVAIGIISTGINYQFYLDGVSKESGATGWVNTNTQDDIHIANNPGTGGAFPGFVYWGGLWKDRVLTNSDALQLYLDSYCFLIYPEDEMFATLVGATTAKVLAAGSGAYNIAGTVAGLKVGRRVVAGVGAYNLTGTSVNLLRGYRVIAGVGAYNLTGSNAGLLRGYRVIAGAGSYIINGTAATLIKGPSKILTADTAAYNISGANTGLLMGRRLTASTGVYQITGSDAALIVTPVGGSPHQRSRRIKGRITAHRSISSRF